MGGETVLGSTGGGAILGALGGASPALKSIHPFMTLFSGAGGLFKCLFTAFHPKNFIRLLLALAISAFWLAPSLFADYGMKPEVAKWLM